MHVRKEIKGPRDENSQLAHCAKYAADFVLELCNF